MEGRCVKVSEYTTPPTHAPRHTKTHAPTHAQCGLPSTKTPIPPHPTCTQLDYMIPLQAFFYYNFVSRVGLVSKCDDQSDVELIGFDKEFLFLLLQASCCC